MAKYVKMGQILNVTDSSGTTRKKVKLGNQGSKDPKYDFTVDVRVKNSEGEVIYKATNPWIDFSNPHPKAPKSILQELQIYVKDEQ